MAYFRKRKSSWTVTVKKSGIVVTETFDKRSDGEAWAKRIEAEILLGIKRESKNSEIFLLEALDRYEREIIPSKKGAAQESMRIRIWKRSSLSKMKLSEIKGKDIAAYRDTRLKEVAPNTVRHELAILSHVFTIAVKEWSLPGLVNPVSQIRLPKSPSGRDRRLLPGEIDWIFPIFKNPYLPAIVLFAIETGMRQAEIAGMTWNQVDLNKRIVTILDTKNGEKRIVPLSKRAIGILAGAERKTEMVWPIKPSEISISFHRAVKSARREYEKRCEEKKEKPDAAFLSDLTFHDLRHEATSRFFEKGLNSMEVSAITGHKTLQMLKRYTHLKAEDLAPRLD